MKQIFKLIAIIAILTFSSCRTTNMVRASTETRDSVIITETIRDTVVNIAPDSSMIQALLECDSIGRVRLARLIEYQSGERIKPPSIEITDNILTAKSEVDSLSIYLKLRDRYKESYRDMQETVIVETNKLTGWQKVRLTIADIVLIALVVCAGVGIAKLIKWK